MNKRSKFFILATTLTLTLSAFAGDKVNHACADLTATVSSPAIEESSPEKASIDEIIGRRILEATAQVIASDAPKEIDPEIEARYQDVLSMVNPQTRQPLLSVVIPAYKEARRLPESLIKIENFLDRYPFPIEVLVIVEKSPDYTYEIASRLVQGDSRITVVDNKVKMGKGYAVRSGMLRATGQYVLFMDADLSTPLHEIFNFLASFKANPGTDVLIGDRKSQQDPKTQNRGFARRALSFGFQRLVKVVSIAGITDTQCGFKAFTQNAKNQIFDNQTLNGFAFDVEVLVLAEQLGFHVASQPVKWVDDDRSTVDPIRDTLRMARDLVRIRGLVKKNLRRRQAEQSTP